MGYNSGALKLLSSVVGVVGAAGSIPTLVETLSRKEAELISGDFNWWRFERIDKSSETKNGIYPIKLGNHRGRFGYCWGKKENENNNENCKSGGVFWGKRIDNSEMGGEYDVILMFQDGIVEFNWADFIGGKLGNSLGGFKNGSWWGTPSQWKEDKYGGGKNYGGIFCLMNGKNDSKENGYGFSNLWWGGEEWWCGKQNDKSKSENISSLYRKTKGGGDKKMSNYCIWSSGGNEGKAEGLFGKKTTSNNSYGICVTTPSQWAWVRKD